MTEQVTDGQLDRLDEVIEELETEHLPEDAPEVQEAAEDESDDGFEDAGEEEHQEEKRKTDGLTRNQRRAQTRYDKIYREKREAQEKAAAAEAKLRQTEEHWAQQYTEMSKQLESILSGSGAGEPGPQGVSQSTDVKQLAKEAALEILREQKEAEAKQRKAAVIDEQRKSLESNWSPIYERVQKTHPAVAGWFLNEFCHEIKQTTDRHENLDILEAVQEFDYPMESLYAAAADESFGRLSMGGKIKLIAKASKKIAVRKSQPSKADNPIEVPNSVGARKGPQSNEEIWLAINGRK
jgi:hypothetical protein